MINLRLVNIFLSCFLCAPLAWADDGDILISMISTSPTNAEMQQVWGKPLSLSNFSGFKSTKNESVKQVSAGKPAHKEITRVESKNKPVSIGGDIANVIERYADKYNVSSRLVGAIIKQESRYNVKATSHKGAQGLMQLMPGTASDCGITDAYDLEQNISCGTKYFAAKLDKYNSVALALAAYNAGDGAVDKYKGIPPYIETQAYVKNILADLGFKD